MNTSPTNPSADDTVIAQLREALGDDRVRTGTDIGDRHLGDWSSEKGGRPLVVVLPRDTADVSRALAICHALRRAVVPQGGLTGLAGGEIGRAHVGTPVTNAHL